MTRVTKFRAWDSQRKMFVTSPKDADFKVDSNGNLTAENYSIYPTFRHHIQQLEIMQFTGLLDKHGKEIYEGDIVEGKSRDPNKLYIGKVHFDSIYGSWVVNGYDWEFYPAHKFQIGIPLGECRFEIEVIGNIYENGDLLNDK